MQRFFFLLFLLVGFSVLNGQDNNTSLSELRGALKPKCSRFRIFGGPSLDYHMNNQTSVGKGMLIGFQSGVEYNYGIGSRMYLVVAVNYAKTNFRSWLKDSSNGTYTFDDNNFIEIPIGFGHHFGKTIPKGFYTTMSVVNSFNIHSTRSIYKTVNGFEATIHDKRDYLDFFNLGLKCELGVKALLEEKYYSSFGLVIKPMAMNMSKSNERFVALSVSVLGSLYF